MYNRRTAYAVKAVAVMRNNPDGTNPSASRFIGFYGTADLSAVLTTHVADLTIKIDDNAVETKSVDFTAAASESAVTVAEAVTALTASAFTGITWTADTDTGRLKGVSATGQFVQVTGALAAALDFGYGIEFPNNGLEIYTYLSKTGLVDCTMPPDIQDKSTKDVEGSEGNVRRMNIPAKLMGVSPVLSVYQYDKAMRACIEGGTYNRSTGAYTPPLSDVTEYPTFCIIKYDGLYNNDNTKLSDNDSVLVTTVHTCQGLQGEDTDTNSWKVKTYNITASEYTDASAVRHPAYEELPISKAAFNALGIDTLMEAESV